MGQTGFYVLATNSHDKLCRYVVYLSLTHAYPCAWPSSGNAVLGMWINTKRLWSKNPDYRSKYSAFIHEHADSGYMS